ncbi:MAG TPA: phytanoyl-CoA dioxygenase family protein [Caulobacteraceae bacterium]|jgi:ectoine hydroxylase-related dioxygenase (phytanoyl-CoA dioxygenase family)|nr:phytanoyl-CoA dioxygenase family protein [Caulobacteraceae bacterium]
MSTTIALDRTRDQALRRTLETVESQGLSDHLQDLDVHGYTVVPGVLSAETVERAKAAIIRRAEKASGHGIDPQAATADDFKGMQYLPYLLFDDPVFAEVLLEPKPLALVTYLLGESCLLSSMGSHFRGPGGMPLMVHTDNGNGMPAPFSPISMVANVNYALTAYSREAGALAMFPGSHRYQRQPTFHENFTPEGLGPEAFAARMREPGGVDTVTWKDPPGAISMDISPGDAVIWHGNTWHGGYRRELPGVRINLSAYFCRQYIQTQERRGDPAEAELLARHDNNPRLSTLLGGKQSYGWRADDWSTIYGQRARQAPRGVFD